MGLRLIKPKGVAGGIAGHFKIFKKKLSFKSLSVKEKNLRKTVV